MLIRTLVVSDDARTSSALATAITGAGHQSHTLPSTIGATRLIQSEQIQVVVLDLSGPEVDGHKLARVLHQDRRFTRPGFVIVTSRPTEELQPVAIALGARDILQHDRVDAELADALHKARPRSQPRPSRPGVDSIPA